MVKSCSFIYSISTDDQLGHFDLLIKTYENGNISRHVAGKNVGEHIEIRGPKGFSLILQIWLKVLV